MGFVGVSSYLLVPPEVWLPQDGRALQSGPQAAQQGALGTAAHHRLSARRHIRLHHVYSLKKTTSY